MMKDVQLEQETEISDSGKSLKMGFRCAQILERSS